MADKEDNEKTEDEPTPKGKKGIVLGGGILCLVALAYTLSLVAVPGSTGSMPFGGPFVVALSPSPLNVNLSQDGGKRIVQLTIKAEYRGYDEDYATQRVADALYLAELQDSLISLIRRKSYSDLEDPVGEEIFKEELREAVAPLLFPVHVGSPDDPRAGDEASGLAPGRSIDRSTFRVGFHDGLLTVDAARKTVSLGTGEPVTFTGEETDLAVPDANGRLVYVDVTGLSPDFSGEVNVGTFGQVREVLFDKFIIQ